MDVFSDLNLDALLGEGAHHGAEHEDGDGEGEYEWEPGVGAVSGVALCVSHGKPR
jgi:hypothetical protein